MRKLILIAAFLFPAIAFADISDMIESWVVGRWPALAAGFAVIAAGLMFLRWIAPKTKTKLDDEIVEKADRLGITDFLQKYNPFKKK